MDRIETLIALDRDLLRKFSSSCLSRLRKHLFFQLALPVINDFLEANVDKEAAKDGMIIEHAVNSASKGKVVGEDEVSNVFERTKKIDAEFIQKAHSRRFSFSIDYKTIENTRKERIRLIIDTVTELLPEWDRDRTFDETVRCVFSREDFGQRISSFLHLYDLETRQLGDSIRILLPARIAKDMLVERLYEVMEEVSDELKHTCLKKVFGR